MNFTLLNFSFVAILRILSSINDQLLAVSAMDGIMAATNTNDRKELEVYTSVVVVVVVVVVVAI